MALKLITNTLNYGQKVSAVHTTVAHAAMGHLKLYVPGSVAASGWYSSIVHHIAIIQMGRTKGLADCEQGPLVQQQA